MEDSAFITAQSDNPCLTSKISDHLNKKPIKAMLSEFPTLRELQNASADVTAQVIEVRMQSVCPSSEVQIVWKEDGLLVLEPLPYLHVQMQMT